MRKIIKSLAIFLGVFIGMYLYNAYQRGEFLEEESPFVPQQGERVRSFSYVINGHSIVLPVLPGYIDVAQDSALSDVYEGLSYVQQISEGRLVTAYVSDTDATAFLKDPERVSMTHYIAVCTSDDIGTKRVSFNEFAKIEKALAKQGAAAFQETSQRLSESDSFKMLDIENVNFSKINQIKRTKYRISMCTIGTVDVAGVTMPAVIITSFCYVRGALVVYACYGDYDGAESVKAVETLAEKFAQRLFYLNRK